MNAEGLSTGADLESRDTTVDESSRGVSITTRRRWDFGCVSTVPLRTSKGPGTAPWRRGVRIDRYELMEEIAVGGMGVVWSARDVDLGRDVAMKLIPSDGWPLEAQRVDLLAEARAMARLSHRNVVTVYDVGMTHMGLFIAMQRMDGGTLRGWLEAAPRTWQEIVARFIGAGHGLAEAHRAGLVHRDFKPDNVLMGADGVPRVSDFGLALPVGAPREGDHRADSEREVTQSGGIAGTLAYMAPEQLVGNKVTARSDQFSFCVALYEALCGVRPFGVAPDQAPAAALLAPDADKQVISLPVPDELPAALHDLIARGLARDPNDRWPSLDALVAELERCLGPSGGRARAATAPDMLGQQEPTSPTAILQRRASGARPHHRPSTLSLDGPAPYSMLFDEPTEAARAPSRRGARILLATGVLVAAGPIAFLFLHLMQRLATDPLAPETRTETRIGPVAAQRPPESAGKPVALAPAPIATDLTPVAPVRTRIISSPPGEVHVPGGGIVCRPTPCSLVLNPDDSGAPWRRTYVIKRLGYKDRPIDIDIDKPRGDISVELEKSGIDGPGEL